MTKTAYKRLHVTGEQLTVSEVESIMIIVGSMATGRPGTATGPESLHLICREKEARHGVYSRS